MKDEAVYRFAARVARLAVPNSCGGCHTVRWSWLFPMRAVGVDVSRGCTRLTRVLGWSCSWTALTISELRHTQISHHLGGLNVLAGLGWSGLSPRRWQVAGGRWQAGGQIIRQAPPLCRAEYS